MKKIQYIFFLFLTANLLSAQSPLFKLRKMEDTYKRTPAEIVCEDHNSALWFGSPKGLFLYDGIEFHLFRKEDSSSNHVRAIFCDRSERLWVGYNDGTVCHFEKQQLQRWQPEGFHPQTPVNGFVEDAGGNIWISTKGEGLFYCSAKAPGQESEYPLLHFTEKDGLPGEGIHAMISDADGRVWTGTDNGLASPSFAEGKLNVETFPGQLTHDAIHSILPDQKGRLWLGFNNGRVVRFDIHSKTVSEPIPGKNTGAINCLELFEDTDLWLGTTQNGLWRFSLTDSTLHPVSRFGQTEVHDLHRDIEGNIWVLTGDKGIYSANRQFEFINNGFSDAQAILSDSRNRIWVGTPQGLLLHQKDVDGNSYFRKFLSGLKANVRSLYEDEFGNIWAGTIDNGIYVVQPATGNIRPISEGLPGKTILSFAGQRGHVWVGTPNGAVNIKYGDNIFKKSNWTFIPLAEGSDSSSNFIHDIFIDSKDRTWFGTEGQRIRVLENGEVKNLLLSGHVPIEKEDGNEVTPGAVYSITEDKNGHIWFSTDNAGIFEFDGQKFRHLDLKEGIRDLGITSLATDAKGQILIVHPTGIDVLIPSSRHLIYYDNEVGIHDFSPNMNATWTDHLGNVWFGGKSTLVKYTSLKENLEIHPRTFLSSVSILLQPIDFSTRSTFAHDENHLAFSYMGLWYTDPAIVKYRYQLVGYDFDWIESKDRRAMYSNLPPGNYTFQVMSTENDAWNNEPVVSYAFKIKSPIWMRWWFFALVLPVLFGLFRLYQKNRDRRIQLVNLMEKDKAESKLATLKAQINPHFLFNSLNTLISVVEKTPGQAVEYIENLSDFYRKIMQLRDKDIIPIQEEVELLKNYTYLLKKRYGNNFHLHIDIPAHEWYIVPLTLQLLVENAVKHNIISKSRPLTIHIGTKEEYIEVTNNLQPKLTAEKSTYFGLQSLVQRYSFLNKKKVKVEQGDGVFKVCIPIIK